MYSAVQILSALNVVKLQRQLVMMASSCAQTTSYLFMSDRVAKTTFLRFAFEKGESLIAFAILSIFFFSPLQAATTAVPTVAAVMEPPS